MYEAGREHLNPKLSMIAIIIFVKKSRRIGVFCVLKKKENHLQFFDGARNVTVYFKYDLLCWYVFV